MNTLPVEAARPYALVDALRAVAALLVVAYHVIVLTPWDVTLTEGPLRLTHMGWIGVDCFFVISGFVITLSTLKGFTQHPSGFWRGFAIRRLARIAPLYLLTSVLFVLLVDRALLSAAPREQLMQAASHLLFVHNLHPSTSGSINGPSWSIGLEMQFYLLFALLLPWIARTRVAWVLAVLVLVAWAYRYLIALILVPGVAQGQLQQIYSAQLPGTLDAFGLGIALGLAVVRARGRLWQHLTPGWTNFGAWLALAIGISHWVWTFYWAWSDFWDSLWMILFWRTLLAMAFACWLTAALTCPKANSRLFAPIRYLGTISYGIYLWHMLVLLTLIKVPGLGHGTMMFGTMGLAIALASLSWHLFEQPLLLRAKRWTEARHTTAAMKGASA